MENKTAEQVLKSKGVTEYSQHHNYAYLYKSIVKAMEEYASQERLKGIEEGFNAAREREDGIEFDGEVNYPASVYKYTTPQDYLNSKP